MLELSRVFNTTWLLRLFFKGVTKGVLTLRFEGKANDYYIQIYFQDFLNPKIPIIEPVRTIVRDVADTVAEEDLVPPISVVQIPSSICKEIWKGANILMKNPTYIVEGPAGSKKVFLNNSTN